MTINEVKEMYKGQFYDVEVYADKFKHMAGFHTDRIVLAEDSGLITYDEVLEYSLMNKEEYSNTILANCGTTWEDYGFDDADKILVIKVKREY